MKHDYILAQPRDENKSDAALAMARYLECVNVDDWRDDFTNWAKSLNDPLSFDEIQCTIVEASKPRRGRPPNAKQLIIGNELGYKVVALKKFGKTADVLWQATIEVDDAQYELSPMTTLEFLSQKIMKQATIDAASIMPTTVNQAVYDELVRAWMKIVTQEDVPIDSSSEGALIDVIYEWLEEEAVSGNEGRQELLNGLPWTDDDGVSWFRSPDLRSLQRRKYVGDNWSSARLWRILRRYQAQHKSFRVLGKVVRCWGVVANRLNPGANVIPLTKRMTDLNKAANVA